MLSYQWAKTIAYLATSRLERPPCDCSPTTTLSIRLMKDIAFTGGDSSFLVDFDILSNPFGTKVGEIYAWNQVSKLGKKIFDGYSI